MSDERDAKLSPTREGERLLEAWFVSQDLAAKAKEHLRRAENDLADAQASLSKWMLPADAKVGDTVLMWHGHRLIQVTKDNHRNTVTIREERKP
jgi:hypothetical protein